MPYHTMEVLCNQDPLNLLCPRLGAKDKSVGTGDLNVHKTTTGSRSTLREEKGLRLSVHLVLPGHQTLNVMC
ncbi:hypothetical protein O3P69_016892 [Scylla paramamosain]|uniref:Uncharacterized protein n=1 Tax=Scylla paramamosain TaxID=85552 RepID=A0AAW0T091_SCYPA